MCCLTGLKPVTQLFQPHCVGRDSMRGSVCLSRLVWISSHFYSINGSVGIQTEESSPICSIWPSLCTLQTVLSLEGWGRPCMRGHALCTHSFRHSSALRCCTVDWRRDDERQGCWPSGAICPSLKTRSSEPGHHWTVVIQTCKSTHPPDDESRRTPCVSWQLEGGFSCGCEMMIKQDCIFRIET